MIIAQSNLLEYKNGEWKAFLIKVHQPELDEFSKIDYYCLVEIGDDDSKRIHGIDSLLLY